MNSRVNLGYLNLRSLLIVFLSKVRVGGGHLLAVPTPGSIEFNHNYIVLANEVLSIGVLQSIH